MKTIKKMIEIKAPAQRVYDFLAQPENLLGVWPNLVSVSNVVASAGGAHDFDWTFKMMGVHFKGHAKTEEAVPGQRLRHRTEGGIPSIFRWALEGLNGSGTRLGLEVEYTMPTPVVGKLAEALAAKLNERDVQTLLANLKDVVEHGATPTVAAAAHAH